MPTVEQIRANAPPKAPQIDQPLQFDLIQLSDVEAVIPPKPELTGWASDKDGPVVALGRAVYETQPQQSTDCLLHMVERLCREIHPGNLWLLPTYERLPYPYAVYWPLACAFQKEKTTGRKFDWYVWIDDDVMATGEDVMKLTEAAKKHGAPFMSAVPYDRFPPHSPSVVEFIDGQPYKWVRAPKSGCYPVLTVGLCLAVFHRSVFDLVPEPWFGVCSPSKGFSGLHPDWWWSYQMRKAKLQPWVCCDTNVVHLGHKLRVDRPRSEAWLDQVIPAKPALYSDMQAESRAISPVTGAEVIVPPYPEDGRTEPKPASAEVAQ